MTLLATYFIFLGYILMLCLGLFLAYLIFKLLGGL